MYFCLTKVKIYKMRILLMFLLFCSSYLYSQEKNEAKYATSPLWIAMMDDTAANYYQVISAFEIYFKYHKMPEEPEEIAHKSMEEGIIIDKPNVVLTDKELAEREVEQELALNIKRYKKWKKEVFPFVQSDGRILSQDEQIKIWEQITGKKAKGE